VIFKRYGYYEPLKYKNKIIKNTKWMIRKKEATMAMEKKMP